MTKIPDCLAHLPKHGGLPIPFVTGHGPDGRTDFRCTHQRNHTLAQRFQLCAICGRHIAQAPFVFAIGPRMFEVGISFEPPMHEACAIAALTLCPFLSRRNWQRDETEDGTPKSIEPAEIPPKPERLGLAYAPRYTPIRNPDNGLWYAEMVAADCVVHWWSYNAAGVLVPERGMS